MLSGSDAAIVARDRGLRGLALMLDADRFAAWLDAAAPDHAIRRVTPLYLRYKPKTSCVAAFRVTDGRDEDVDLYAKAYAENHYAIVARRREKAAFAGLALPRLISAEHHFAVRHAAADRELPALKRLADPGQRPKLLAALVPQAGEDATLETIRYKAERRFVGRILRDGTPLALVKAYTKAQFPKALERARLAHGAGFAELVGTVETRSVIAFAWRPGTTLDGLDTDGRAAAFRQAGAAIAAVHAGPVVPAFKRGRRQELDAASRAAATVSILLPDLGGQASALVRRAAEAYEAVDPGLDRAVTVHGDFSADQILVADGAAAILDWDELSVGEAEIDLGSFAARLEADEATGLRAPGEAQRAFAALLEGYEAIREAAAPRIALHTVLGLVRLAPEPFRYRQPDWPERMAVIVGRAGAILNRGGLAPVLHRRAG